MPTMAIALLGIATSPGSFCRGGPPWPPASEFGQRVATEGHPYNGCHLTPPSQVQEPLSLHAHCPESTARQTRKVLEQRRRLSAQRRVRRLHASSSADRRPRPR